jgi:CheY-like chemotaxis protein
MTEEWLLPPLSILLVEDHEDTAQTAAELLAMAGARVRIAATAVEALKLAAEEAPDVIFIEPMIRDGWQAARELRQVCSPKLVVVVSSGAEEEDFRRSTAAGADLHLVKPVAPALMLDVLKRLERPAQQ